MADQDRTLFHVPPNEASEAKRPVAPRGAVRLQTAERSQMRLLPMSLDRLLGEDHHARAVWAYVEGLDLSAIYETIKAREGVGGRSPIDPKILVALWLLATVDGVGSARAIDRLSGEHVAYRWICGGVSVNYHTLSDFRTGHGEALDKLLTESVAVLQHEDLVDLARVSIDGMRVRASAGAASFRREQSLQECLQAAEQRVEALRREIDDDPSATSKRQQAARLRASEERAKRVRDALAQLPEVRAKKKSGEKEDARVSTTDPDARVMKMADGGFRPAYNVQLGADTKTQVIVGVDVNNVGSDRSQMEPMVEQIEKRHDVVPDDVLVDGGFVNHAQIEQIAGKGCKVYAPVQKPRDATRDPHSPCARDSAGIAKWRERMGTEEAKAIYKQRAATSECINAIARNRGLQRFVVRGLHKVKAVVLWFALAHNMTRTIVLRARAARAALAAVAAIAR